MLLPLQWQKCPPFPPSWLLVVEFCLSDMWRVIPLTTFVDSPHPISKSNLTEIGMGILIMVKQSTIATLAGFILVQINLYQFFRLNLGGILFHLCPILTQCINFFCPTSNSDFQASIWKQNILLNSIEFSPTFLPIPQISQSRFAQGTVLYLPGSRMLKAN